MIHKIEKENLPEFFCGSPKKSPQIYKNLRNKIIALFYKFADKYLTATNCL